MRLSEKERQEINALVSRFESSTAIEALAVVTRRADAYPEIPWKAYAIGTTFGALAALVVPWFSTAAWDAAVVAIEAMLVLGAGAALALAAVFVPPIGRLFISRPRLEGEALQCALATAHARALFSRPGVRALLILLCTYERIAVVVVDATLRPYAPDADLERIGRAAGSVCARRGAAAAFALAFERVRELLEARGCPLHAPVRNAIADDVMETRA